MLFSYEAEIYWQLSVMIGKSLYKILELQIKLRASYASLKLKNWKRV